LFFTERWLVSILSETLWLQPNADAPARARRWLAEWCVQWGCADLEDDAALLLSELVTNAVTHARTTITVSARFVGSELRVAVADRQPGEVRPKALGPAADSGRGLALVQQLAAEWGVQSLRGGKFVWFTLTSGGARPDLAYVLAGGGRPGGLTGPRRGLSARR
jgi:anti-sigma regulatory factor (Ser/Thr protein kinase)